MSARDFQVIWTARFQTAELDDSFEPLVKEFEESIAGQQEFFAKEPIWVRTIFSAVSSTLHRHVNQVDEKIICKYYTLFTNVFLNAKMLTRLDVIHELMTSVSDSIIILSPFRQYIETLITEIETQDYANYTLIEKREFILHMLSFYGTRIPTNIPDLPKLKSLLAKLSDIDKQIAKQNK